MSALELIYSLFALSPPCNPPESTLAEINKKVVGDFFAKKIFSDRVRKGLKFLFNLKGRA